MRWMLLMLLMIGNVSAADKVKITLNWVPEPEFGGIYAARENGAFANFLKNKYGFGNVKVVAYDGGPGNFLANKDFAQQCFITSEPIAVKKQGSDPQVFLIADSGYNPYTAVIITTGKLAKENPSLV